MKEEDTIVIRGGGGGPIDVPPPPPPPHSVTPGPSHNMQLQPPLAITLTQPQPPPLPPPFACQDLPPLPQPPEATKTSTPSHKCLSPDYVPPPELPPMPQPLPLPAISSNHPPTLRQVGKTTSTISIGSNPTPLKIAAKVRRKSVFVPGKDQRHTSPPPPPMSSAQQPLKAQTRRFRANSNYHGTPIMLSTPSLGSADRSSEAPPPVVKLFQDELSVMTALEKARAPMYEPGASTIFEDFIRQLKLPGAHTGALTPRSERVDQRQDAGERVISGDFVAYSNFAPVKSTDFFADPVPQNLSINPTPFQPRYADENGDERKRTPQKGGDRGNNDDDIDSNDEDDEISKTFSKRPGHAQSEIAKSLRNTNIAGTPLNAGNLILSKSARKDDANEVDAESLQNQECSCEVDQETQMAVVKPVVLKSLLTDEIKAYDAIQEKLQKKHKYIVSLPPDYNTKVTIELTEAGTILNAVNEVLKTYKAGPVILKSAPEAYVLYMADDAGLPETDFPAPDVTRRIIDMQCSTFALYENPKYDAPIILEIKLPPEAKKSGGRISVPIKRGKTVKQVLHEVCKKLGLKSSRYELQMELFPVPLSLQTLIEDIGATELALVKISGSDEIKKESSSPHKRRSMAISSGSVATASTPHSYQVIQLSSKHGKHKSTYTMEIDGEKLVLTPVGSDDNESGGSGGFRLVFKSKKTAKVFRVSDVIDFGEIPDKSNEFFMVIGEDQKRYEFESAMKHDILSQLKALIKKKESGKSKERNKSKG